MEIKINKKKIVRQIKKYPNKAKRVRKYTKVPLSSSCVSQPLRDMGPCSLYNEFSFAGRYPLQIASWLEIGDPVNFAFLVPGPWLAETYADPVYAATVAELICSSVLLCLEDTGSLGLSITSGSYNVSVSSSAKIPEH